MSAPALSGMLSGYVTEQYARMEHLTWFEALPPDAIRVAPEPPNGSRAKESDIQPLDHD